MTLRDHSSCVPSESPSGHSLASSVATPCRGIDWKSASDATAIVKRLTITLSGRQAAQKAAHEWRRIRRSNQRQRIARSRTGRRKMKKGKHLLRPLAMSCDILHLRLAERAGFEPAEQFYPFAALAKRCDKDAGLDASMTSDEILSRLPQSLPLIPNCGKSRKYGRRCLPRFGERCWR